MTWRLQLNLNDIKTTNNLMHFPNYDITVSHSRDFDKKFETARYQILNISNIFTG